MEWGPVCYPTAVREAEAAWVWPQSPWSDELVTGYLEELTAPGALVLDPFASHPALARAGVRAGRRVLMTHLDPVSLLLTRVLADPPGKAAQALAFTTIADIQEEGQPLAQRMDALYRTFCPGCATEISADWFIWDRASGVPLERGYTCPHCGSTGGPSPLDLADLEVDPAIGARGAMYWWLVSRLVARDDPLLPRVQSLLEIYPPRSRFVLTTILQQAEAHLTLRSEALRLWRAWSALALTRTHSLHTQPDDVAVPESLRLPRRFVERNAWRVVEWAYETLNARAGTSPLPWAPSLAALLGAPQPAAFAWLATSRDVARHLSERTVDLILTDPARPDPTALALRFLWAGWLFGRDLTTSLRPLLTHKVADPQWYTQAMAVALRTLAPLLRPGGHLVLAFEETHAGLLEMLLLAAEWAGYQLVNGVSGLAPEGQPAMHYLIFEREHPRPVRAGWRETATEALAQVVKDRAEPVPDGLARSVILRSWAQAGLLARPADQGHASRASDRETLDAWLQEMIEMPPPPLVREVDKEAWWRVEEMTGEPLADRLEQWAYERLIERAWSFRDLALAACRAFPGRLTPDLALLRACLAAYAREVEGVWVLRPEDRPEARAKERGELLLRLWSLGHRLGYEVWISEQERALSRGLVPVGHPLTMADKALWPCGVIWHEDDRPAWGFALTLHAWVGRWHTAPSGLVDVPHYVVMPGSKAALLQHKLDRYPYWRGVITGAGWQFIKFRLLRRLADQPDLDRPEWQARLTLDPIVAIPQEQLSLFDKIGEESQRATCTAVLSQP